MRKTYKTIRRHIITGFIFVMPVLITLAVISKFWKKFLLIGGKVSKLIRVDTLFGPNGDAVVAVILFLLLCIIAGYLVKMTMFKRMSDWLDGKLSAYIPGYRDMKKEAEVKIGTNAEPVFHTCLVDTGDLWKPAYLIDLGTNGNATVFIPEAPSFKNGQVVVVPAGKFKKLEIDSKALNSFLGKMGKGLTASI
jgi:uncharacterized membrane protein